MTNVIIYLIAFAGTGKLTIAKELSSRINARIVDNHLINNPIFSLISLDGKTPLPELVWDKVAQVREAVFTTIEEASPKDFNFIFTNELLESSEADKSIYYRVAAIAKKRNSIFVPVRLVCDIEELAKRVNSPERISSFKMTDIFSTREKFAKEKLFMPDAPYAFSIDITNLTPQESAEEIISVLKTLTH